MKIRGAGYVWWGSRGKTNENEKGKKGTHPCTLWGVYTKVPKQTFSF